MPEKRSRQCAIYPGSFDPTTNGHIQIAARAATIVDRLIVAVAKNEDKKPLFSLEERINLAQSCLSDYPSIEVVGFSGLLLDFAESQKAQIIIRGLRVVSDFEYEFQLAMMNKRLNPDVETVLLMSPENSTFISASMVKEVAMLGGDVQSLVKPCVYQALKRKFAA